MTLRLSAQKWQTSSFIICYSQQIRYFKNSLKKIHIVSRSRSYRENWFKMGLVIMRAGTQTSAVCVLERLAENVHSPSCPEEVLALAFLLCSCSVGVLTSWAERRRSPSKRDVLGWELGPFSGQWSGSVGFSFTLFPRVAELQGEDIGSFYLNIFFNAW